MAGHNDLGYKYLFAHPELVRELLADFTDFQALGALAPSAFERVNPGYVSDRFSERHDDIVWRAKVGEQWCYICIFLAFPGGAALRADRPAASRPQCWAEKPGVLAMLFQLELSDVPKVLKMVYRCWERGWCKTRRRPCGARCSLWWSS
ncbi:hypothetical protein [Massilia sp. TSP1-1-2]|uniref:hypothetical protein n=1 Tax=Massilia sp. TSP1-1-2 TaxID=2804649 RepID=UPI003CEFF559